MLTVYKASAGSGKTYTLTKLYLKMLLGIKQPGGSYLLNHSDFATPERNRHRHILAITFTNKATEEMKERIITKLDELAETPEQSPYTEEFTALFGCTPQQLAQTARLALNDLLYDFREFNVSTIDSFFQQVLRALAYELDYPGDYEVELNSGAVVSEATAQMLDNFNYNPETDSGHVLASTIRQFMLAERQRGRAFNIFNRNIKVHKQLVRRAQNIFSERYQLVAREFEEWTKDPEALTTMQSNLENWQKSLADTLPDAIAALREEVADGGFEWDKHVSSFMRKLLEKLADPANLTASELAKSKTYQSLYQARAEGGWGGYNKKASETSGYEHTRRLLAAGRKIAKTLARYFAAGSMLGEIQTYRFMNLVNGFVSKFRSDNNIILLADTNRLLQRVTDEGNVPFVYEKMGVNLRHFLIDEFQDTSRMQWQNLMPMVEDGLSEGHDSLIIGDEKQSIYRFRNSDSNLLRVEVERHFGTQVDKHGLTPAENTNWRSAPGIVRFNNTLFKALAANLDINSYGNVVQGIASKNDAKTAYVKFVSTKGMPEVDAEPEDLRIKAMIAEITRQHEAGYRWSDIAVLDARRRVVAKASLALLAAGIPVATDEALLVDSAQSVKLIVSILEMLRRGDSVVEEARKKAVSIRTMIVRFNYLNSLARFGDKEYTPASAIEALNLAADSMNTEVSMPGAADVLGDRPSSLTTLVETIIERRIPHRQRVAEAPYLAAFHDAVLNYTSTYGNNLIGFLRWWNNIKGSLSVASPAQVDAVRMMTIHKSKGLEFKCVHVVDGSYALTGRKGSNEDTWLRVPRRLRRYGMPPGVHVAFKAEATLPFSPFAVAAAMNRADRVTDGMNRNYVAFTRAERELCVYYEPDVDFGRQFVEAVESVNFTGDPLLCTLSHNIDPNGNFVMGKPTVPGYEGSEPATAGESTQTADGEPATDNIILADEYNVTLGGEGSYITNFEALVGEEPDVADPTLCIDTEATARGDRLHYALSLVRTVPEGLEGALRRARRRGLSDDEADFLRAELNRPELQKYIERWFGKGLRTAAEMPVFVPESGSREATTFRPDRIVWHADGSIEIVDYKFTTTATSGHRRQVENYCRLLQKIYPGVRVAGALWYVDLAKVVEVR